MADEEEIVAEEEAEEGPAALKKLREKLTACVAEKQEYLNGWQRARADFANYKKDETSRDSERMDKLRAELAEAVIPALDTFDAAFAHSSYQNTGEEWRGGMENIYKELLKSLEHFGIVRFSPVGESFDPNKHEAMRQISVPDAQQHHMVVSVERAGYTLGDKVIRPAHVSIGVAENS